MLEEESTFANSPTGQTGSLAYANEDRASSNAPTRPSNVNNRGRYNPENSHGGPTKKDGSLDMRSAVNRGRDSWTG